FGGTGLFLMAFVAAPIFNRLPRKHKYISLFGASGMLLWYLNTELGSSVFTRVSEFGSKGASASLRWTEPFEELSSLFNQESLFIMVGHGPGASLTELSPIIKILYEYGLLGAVPYMLMILYCFFSDARSKIVSSALLFMHLFLSGSFLTPHTLYFFYVILMFVPVHRGVPIGLKNHSIGSAAAGRIPAPAKT
ncbi:MAG: hypothetical protein M3Q32_02280, partial [Pseudomonadota bacterium]|nr:hypothetical protein [Pseudomonadota bacterium]